MVQRIGMVNALGQIDDYASWDKAEVSLNLHRDPFYPALSFYHFI